MDKHLMLKRFGDCVRTTRLAASLTQEELAHRSGLDRSYIGGVERGERNPSLLAVGRIAEGLGVCLTTLFDPRAAATQSRKAE